MTTHNLFDDQAPACPDCGTNDALPVVYLEPSEEMITASRLGLIALGEWTESAEAPQWKCRRDECGRWI